MKSDDVDNGETEKGENTDLPDVDNGYGEDVEDVVADCCKVFAYSNLDYCTDEMTSAFIFSTDPLLQARKHCGAYSSIDCILMFG